MTSGQGPSFGPELVRGRRRGLWSRPALVGCLAALGVLGTGCLGMKQYIDPGLPRVAYTDLKPVEPKRPVQVYFEFRTKGATNAKATEFVRPMVLDTLKRSGMFSDVVVAPATADDKLYVTIDNVPVDKDAASKGFMTGLTFGLAGSMVTDGYVMETGWVAANKAEVKRTYRHAIHTTIGNADGPPGLTPVPKEPKGEAVRLMTEGLILNLLNDMSKGGEPNRS